MITTPVSVIVCGEHTLKVVQESGCVVTFALQLSDEHIYRFDHQYEAESVAANLARALRKTTNRKGDAWD